MIQDMHAHALAQPATSTSTSTPLHTAGTTRAAQAAPNQEASAVRGVVRIAVYIVHSMYIAST